MGVRLGELILGGILLNIDDRMGCMGWVRIVVEGNMVLMILVIWRMRS